MTYAHTRIITALAFAALLGFGCEAPKEGREGAQGSKNATAEVGTESPAPSDGEPVVSGEGKMVYENGALDLRFSYLKGWHIKEGATEKGTALLLTSSSSLEDGTDAIPDVRIYVEAITLEEAVNDFSPYDSKSTELINGIEVVKLKKYSELLEANEEAFLITHEGKTYQVLGLTDDPIIEQIVAEIVSNWNGG